MSVLGGRLPTPASGFSFSGFQNQFQVFQAGGGVASSMVKRVASNRFRANMAHTRQSRPDSGLGFQVKLVKPYQVVPSLLGSGKYSSHVRLMDEGRPHL